MCYLCSADGIIFVLEQIPLSQGLKRTTKKKVGRIHFKLYLCIVNGKPSHSQIYSNLEKDFQFIENQLIATAFH
jgi:hypothetical protein